MTLQPLIQNKCLMIKDSLGNLFATIKDIDQEHILKVILLSIIAILLSDVPETNIIFLPTRLIIFGLLLFSIFLPTNKAVALLLILLLSGRDVTGYTLIEGYRRIVIYSSVWNLKLFQINPSMIIFIVILLHILKLPRIYMSRLSQNAILWFSTIPIICMLIFADINDDNFLTSFFVDIKLPMLLISSIILFESLFRDNYKNLVYFMEIFIGAIIARHCVDFVYLLISKSGPQISGINIVSNDSAKSLSILLIYISCVSLLYYRRIFISILLLLINLTLIVVYGERWNWLILIVGLFILIYFIKKRKLLLLSSLIILFIMFGFNYLSRYFPESAKLFTYRAKPLMSYNENNSMISLDVYLNKIDTIRYGEIINVFDNSVRRGSIILGNGYGSWYTDSAVNFSGTLVSAFPIESYYTRKFYNTHTFVGELILKYGIVGFIFVSLFWIRPLFTLIQNRNLYFDAPKMEYLYFTIFLIAFASFLAVGYTTLYWSGKGLIINGFIISLCNAYISMFSASSYNRNLMSTHLLNLNT